jgi:F-type H+-transporting ATPase subunit beta
MENLGKITQIMGAVVDVQFERDQIPSLYNALEIQLSGREKLILEVQQHVGDGAVRTVAMSATDGLIRGMEVRDMEGPICVPVGDGVLGRILNVTGDPIDGGGEVKCEKKLPIHRSAPTLLDPDIN